MPNLSEKKAKKAVLALKRHTQRSHEPLDLVIETRQPTSKTKEFTPRIIPLPNRIDMAKGKKVVLVTKDPAKTYKDALTKKGAPSEDYFKEIMPFKKFRAAVRNRKSALKLCHDNDMVLVDNRLAKLLPEVLEGTIFVKGNKKYPLLVQMAPPDPEAKLVRGTKSHKLKDERCDPAYVMKQVRVICHGTSFVPNKGSCLDITVGYTDMESKQLIENIERVLEYVTNRKYAPVGGVVKYGLDGIEGLHVKTPDSTTLPILEGA